MTIPTVACAHCGKNFTTDDLRGMHCKYCGTLLAHHARAQEQVAVLNHMLADRNGNGIPDAYEGLIANAQANAMNQAFGMNPSPYGQPMASGHPHVRAPNIHTAQTVTKTASAITLVIIVMVLVGITVFMIGIGVAAYLMSVR